MICIIIFRDYDYNEDTLIKVSSFRSLKYVQSARGFKKKSDPAQHVAWI